MLQKQKKFDRSMRIPLRIFFLIFFVATILCAVNNGSFLAYSFSVIAAIIVIGSFKMKILQDPKNEWMPEPRLKEFCADSEIARAIPGSNAFVLKAKSPVMAALELLFFAVAWNGIQTVIFYNFIVKDDDWKQDWVLLGFMAFFGLIGILIVVAFTKKLIAIKNPRSIVIADQSVLYIGSNVQLVWAFKGNIDRLQNLEISLVGMECSQVSSNNGTTTVSEVFIDRKLFSSQVKDEFKTGQLEVCIASGSMHSFKTLSNEVRWELKFSGAVKFMPDLEESYFLAVRPGGQDKD